jgi:hypothetical protein
MAKGKSTGNLADNTVNKVRNNSFNKTYCTTWQFGARYTSH